MPFFDHSLCDRRAGGFESHALGPKKKGSHCWEPIKSVVGDEGCPRAASPPASASGLRPSRAAPENASRFLSSAPCRVRIPLRWAQKRKAPIDGSLSNRWWAMRDVRVRLAPPALASGLRPSRAAPENASRFLNSAPCRVRIPLRWAHTKTVPFRGPFPIRWWAMRDSNPQPCACKAPALTVAPIARRD